MVDGDQNLELTAGSVIVGSQQVRPSAGQSLDVVFCFGTGVGSSYP